MAVAAIQLHAVFSDRQHGTVDFAAASRRGIVRDRLGPTEFGPLDARRLRKSERTKDDPAEPAGVEGLHQIGIEVGVARRLPPAYLAYLLVALALPLSWPVGPQPLMSLPRFEAVLFPAFMWLGSWIARGGALRGRVVYGAFGAGLATFSAFVATWHWVA